MFSKRKQPHGIASKNNNLNVVVFPARAGLALFLPEERKKLTQFIYLRFKVDDRWLRLVRAVLSQDVRQGPLGHQGPGVVLASGGHVDRKVLGAPGFIYFIFKLSFRHLPCNN